MGLLGIFNNNSKKKRKKRCDITGTILEFGEGRLLTTSQVVTSRKFWDSIMTEPEAMAYTIGHFKNNDQNATKMREIIFEKYAEKREPWIVAEDCLNTFGIEADKDSKEFAQQWWESDFEFKPPQCGEAREVLDPDKFSEVRKYAIMSAGASRVE